MFFLVAAFNDREARAWANDHNIDNWKLINSKLSIYGHIDCRVVLLQRFFQRPESHKLWDEVIEYGKTHNFKHVPSYDPFQE